MQLAITFLGHANTSALTSVLKCIGDCNCQITELRSLNHNSINTCHLRINGNWNHIAKLESSLSSLNQNHAMGLQMHRLEQQQEYPDSIPYLIETLALDNKEILTNLVVFLEQHGITILEISSSCYPAHHVSNSLFSSKFLIAIPHEQALVTFREEFLDYCDQLNVDALLEPLKNKTL